MFPLLCVEVSKTPGDAFGYAQGTADALSNVVPVDTLGAHRAFQVMTELQLLKPASVRIAALLEKRLAEQAVQADFAGFSVPADNLVRGSEGTEVAGT